MNFMEAVASLKMGKTCTRLSNQDSYIVLLQKQNYVWQVNGQPTQPAINATVYSPSIKDIEATDWIVVERQ